MPLVLAVCDYIAIWLAVNVSYSLRDFFVPGSHFHLSWLSIHVIVPAVYLLFLQLHHLLHGACSSGRSFRVSLNPFSMP